MVRVTILEGSNHLQKIVTRRKLNITNCSRSEELPLIVAADASSYGLVACIQQADVLSRMIDHNIKPEEKFVDDMVQL